MGRKHRDLSPKEHTNANKHKKRCSTLLATLEMQIKAIMRNHYLPLLFQLPLSKLGHKKFCEDAQKLDVSHTAGGNVKWQTMLDTKHELITNPATLLLYLCRRNKNLCLHKILYTNVNSSSNSSSNIKNQNILQYVNNSKMIHSDHVIYFNLINYWYRKYWMSLWGIT